MCKFFFLEFGEWGSEFSFFFGVRSLGFGVRSLGFGVRRLRPGVWRFGFGVRHEGRELGVWDVGDGGLA